jgi:hypothetical protein
MEELPAPLLALQLMPLPVVFAAEAEVACACGAEVRPRVTLQVLVQFALPPKGLFTFEPGTWNAMRAISRDFAVTRTSTGGVVAIAVL